MKKHAVPAILSAAMVILLAGCLPKQAGSGKQVIENIDTAKAEVLIRDNATNSSFVILDVRTPREFEGGHIASAVNLNIGSPDFAARLDKLDRSKLYLVYCHSGNRSGRALEAMRQMGFINARNLFGGIVEWKAAGLPVVK